MKRQEHIAKLMGDFGKTIFAVGFATYFFDKFSIIVRVSLLVAFIILITASIFLLPEGD